MKQFEKLRMLMGNDSNRVAMFLDIYKKEIPKQLDLLEKYIIEQQWDSAVIAAHGIKSQSAYLEAKEIVSLTREIEKECEERHDLKDIYKKYRIMKNAVDMLLLSI